MEVFMKKIFIGILSIAFSSGLLFYNGQADGLLHVYFLDVGQGDAILIRTPAGKNILFDGGPQKKVIAELKNVLPFFANTIDAVFLTHPDRDHIEGLLSVLRKYHIGRVYFTGAAKKNYFWRTFLQIIKDKKIPAQLAYGEDDIRLDDGVIIDILFPFKPDFSLKEDINNTSLIAKIIYGENEILLTGDSEALEEERLLKARVNIDADVLKIAHHGSKTSTSPAFLDAVSPETSVISVGKGNSYH
ncbi:MBL fold metallo-hydrolase, partial [Candidatus Peregrinibacteria bacterium]|nr:MBL fold metallo-hydrolase [Candidatus Peregrinibacteria bacterium]